MRVVVRSLPDSLAKSLAAVNNASAWLSGVTWPLSSLDEYSPYPAPAGSMTFMTVISASGYSSSAYFRPGQAWLESVRGTRTWVLIRVRGAARDYESC